MDYFLNDNNCIERLYQEWEKYDSLIIAYDYDNTVFDYHGKGYSFESVIELIRECAKLNFHLIVFTSCESDKYEEISNFLNANSIPFNAINETPEFIASKGRKVYYNILLDDRSGLSSAYVQLWQVIYKIRLKQLGQHPING